MDLSCCLRCFRSHFDGPCTGLILAGSQITHQSQQFITCLDQFLQTGLLNSQIIQEHLLLIVFQLCDLLLNLRTDDKHTAVLLFCQLADCLYMRIGSSVIRQIILGNICCKNDRFCCQQIVLLHPCLFIFIFQLQADRRFSVFQMRFDSLLQFQLFRCCLIHSGCLCRLGNSSLQNLQI